MGEVGVFGPVGSGDWASDGEYLQFQEFRSDHGTPPILCFKIMIGFLTQGLLRAPWAAGSAPLRGYGFSRGATLYSQPNMKSAAADGMLGPRFRYSSKPRKG